VLTYPASRRRLLGGPFLGDSFYEEIRKPGFVEFKSDGGLTLYA
jgi:hypothetical protein